MGSVCVCGGQEVTPVGLTVFRNETNEVSNFRIRNVTSIKRDKLGIWD